MQYQWPIHLLCQQQSVSLRIIRECHMEDHRVNHDLVIQHRCGVNDKFTHANKCVNSVISPKRLQ